MAKKASIDFDNINYNKPFYINSFNADEIIFNTIRKTPVKLQKYDGSLPVSLDSLEIWRVCTSEFGETFPLAFEQKDICRGNSHKIFCNAVINVNFSEPLDFTDVAQIKEDYVQLYPDGAEINNRAKSILSEEIKSEEFRNSYLYFLDKYHENQNCWKQKASGGHSGSKAKVLTDLELDNQGIVLKEVTVAVNGTKIKISAKAKNNNKENTHVVIRLYLCSGEPCKINKRLGVYEFEDNLESQKLKTIKEEFDIRDLMEEKEDNEGNSVFRIDAGKYCIYVEGSNNCIPIAALELEKNIEQNKRDKSSNWLDPTELANEIPEFGDYKYKIQTLNINPGIQITYKKCAQKYEEILENAQKYEKIFEKYKFNSSYDRREFLYINGFDANTNNGIKHYVPYKRSASKSKTGSCLFIWEDIYERMIRDWTWMEQEFDKEVNYDLTSIKAYEALTLSSIENMFNLEPKNILLIDSPMGDRVKGNRRIICKNDGTDDLLIKTVEECESCSREDCKKAVCEYANRIWDGQALLDESVFKRLFTDNGTYTQHAMVLLRNHFFKACAFNTRITEYYRSNGISEVFDMFGDRYEAEDIKLIITPDSLKFLKFDKALFEEPFVKPNLAAYTRWKNYIKDHNPPFGVVKTDKQSKETYNVGYQILNTLPLDEKTMTTLFNDEKEYIEKLWNDNELFVTRIPKETAKGRFMRAMYKKYPNDFIKTQVYIEYKRQIINDIKKQLRRGRLKLKGDMYTLCSMPYEMLEYSGKYSGIISRTEDYDIKPILGPGEAYIEGIKENDQITLCRYPHMSSGSVCVLKQKSHDVFTRWFNFKNPDGNSNIVIISPWESNIMVKLGGADFDSDTALFVKDKTFQEAAKQLLNKDGIIAPLCKKYPPLVDGLPVAQKSSVLTGENIPRSNNPEQWAKLDHDLAKTQKNIGRISNDIQLFNCYLWEALFERKDEGYIEAIYDCILKLAVLNELEIDRSKHHIELDTEKALKKIMNTQYEGKPIILSEDHTRKQQRANKKGESFRDLNISYIEQPAFLYEIKRDNGNKYISLRKNNKYWNCPADHLSRLASNLRKPTEIVIKKEIDFNSESVRSAIGKANTDQVNKIKEILKTALKELNQLNKKRHRTADEAEVRERIHSSCVDKIVRLKIREKTMYSVLRDIMCIKKKTKNPDGEPEYWDSYMYKNKYPALGLLFEASDIINEQSEKADCENIIEKYLNLIVIKDIEN